MIHILVADDYVIVRKGFTEILFEKKMLHSRNLPMFPKHMN